MSSSMVELLVYARDEIEVRRVLQHYLLKKISLRRNALLNRQ